MSRWLWSYAVVLLIPILVMAATHLQTRRVLEGEILRANSALLSQLQQEIDNYIDFTYRLSEVINFNPKVTSTIRNQKDIGTTERMAIVQLLADFKAYNLTKDYVSSFYLYFPEGDFVLTGSSFYDTVLFYQQFIQSSGLSLEEWKKGLARAGRGTFSGIESLDAKGKTGIQYSQMLPIQQNSPSKATLVIELNEEQLVATLRNIQSYNEGHVYILDAANVLLASTEGEPAKKREFDFDGVAGERIQKTDAVWDGEPVVISYIESAKSNWKYAYVLPARIYSEKAEYVWNLALLMLAIAAALGFAIAVLLARRNYSPLKKLVNNVANRSELKSLKGSKVNEYDYLEEAIDSTLDRYHLMNRTLEKQNKTLRSNLLVKLLKGRIEQDFPMADVLPEYGIQLHSEEFAVVLFYLEDYSGFFRLDEQDEEKNREFVHLIMINIIEEMAGQKHQGWMTEIDEMLACIVNLKPGTPQEESVEHLKSLTEEAQRFIGERFHIRFTVSVSSMHRSAAELPVAYQESLDAMEYRMLFGDQTIIWHDRIKDQKPSYDYTMEKEQQLLNYVMAGDFPGAKQMLHDIIDRNLAQENISVDMIRCLMFDICSTMMKVAMESQLDPVELYSENLEAIRELMNGSTVASLRERMTLFLQKVCGFVEERKKNNKKIRLKENVIAYIEEHYRDTELSINMIAEHFHVHPSYLSRYFKEQVGDNLTEYLNRYRVEQSKVQLLQEEIYIRDISEKVGFHSISTYIRLFKKYEGVTPSAYREAKKYQVQLDLPRKQMR
ncbi:helix-turn-helix domain-containing protein [Paenibacillus aurantius]|uniref:Helix-turn-helix domain-containing protein n=1 Tax=Paenibacillus aurantius TaxID=2918900 RepID=A0AA96L8B9_9BACL|nr:helix-turn-helix domain-containing protein [Paenibacillus aurantius]WNQ08887.1 helix-turn-helix domain-containing protein [Paenibacillus aurantius]